ncbi:hypothetical protein IAT40_007490 [Kwoniella sp. CBS 6097]
MAKRLVMNPPASFLEYAASLQPDIPIPAGPLVIAQPGQAVMLAPQTNSDSKSNGNSGSKGMMSPPAPIGPAESATIQEIQEAGTASEEKVAPPAGEVVLDGSSLMLMPDATTAFLAATAAATATPTITSESAISTSQAIPSSAPSASATISASAISSGSMIITSSSTSTSTGTSSPSSTSTSSQTTPTLPASSTPSSSAGTRSGSSHKPPSAGIIFLIILLALALFIAIASALRYFLKTRASGSGCFGRRRGRRGRDDDDDLSDIVRFEGGRAYDPFSDGKEFNHHTMTEEDIPPMGMGDRSRGTEDEGLERRASLFAREGRSPFLHSGTSDHPSPELPFHSAGDDGMATGHASYINPSPLVLPVPPAQAFTRAKFRAAASRGLASDLNPYIGAGTEFGMGAEREESIAPLPGHLYGQTGPLEVRNALPGEVEPDEDHDQHHDERYRGDGGVRGKCDVAGHENEEAEARGVEGLVGLGLGGGSPRFLGVDGSGLSVPWSVSLPHRPSSIDSFDARHTHHPNPFGSSSTLTADHPRVNPHQSSAAGGLHAPPMFNSPVPSHDTDLDDHDLSLPQRSATWASNLRNTLYNAINAASSTATATAAATARAPTSTTGLGDGDRFTRTVGAVARASSRRKAIPSFAGPGFDDLEKGLQVVEEKDDPFTASQCVNEKCLIPPVPTTIPRNVSSKMLSRIESGDSSSSSSASTLMVLPRRKGATASERYKQYYARPKGAIGGGSGLSPVPMTDMPSEAGASEAEVEVEDEVVRPPVLGAGGRAKGARTGSFVIA